MNQGQSQMVGPSERSEEGEMWGQLLRQGGVARDALTGLASINGLGSI